MKQIINSLKNFKRWELVLILFIIIGGIFLRAYNFSDWARFNDDQVRDALIVDRMVSGEEFPLLGPKAGGTHFNLGPAFYYLEYFSALIFGNTPESLAYPVLIFSILAIPLFYLIFKKIFGQNVSLALTAVFASSFFLIKYSRFAWNMNLIPFFVLAFIYLLNKVFEKDNEKKFMPAILLGLTIGIGIQLHTLLLICFPVVFVLFSMLDLLKNKKFDFWKIIFVIIAALAINSPSIIYEAKTGGENTKAFFKGATSKTKDESSIREKFSKNLNCQIQGNAFVLSAYGDDDECNIFQEDKESEGWARKLNVSLSIIFFIGGSVLALFFSVKKKYFWENGIFRAMIIYFFISFVIFSFLAGEISLRMFTASIFVPFLLLGLWMEVIRNRMARFGKVIIILFLIFILFFNFWVFKGVYFPLGDMYRSDKYFGGASLGELKEVADYIKDNSASSKEVRIFSFTNARSLEYLLEKTGLDAEVRSDDELENGKFIFH